MITTSHMFNQYLAYEKLKVMFENFYFIFITVIIILANTCILLFVTGTTLTICLFNYFVITTLRSRFCYILISVPDEKTRRHRVVKKLANQQLPQNIHSLSPHLVFLALCFIASLTEALISRDSRHFFSLLN